VRMGRAILAFVPRIGGSLAGFNPLLKYAFYPLGSMQAAHVKAIERGVS
jgi:hypothetical protein